SRPSLRVKTTSIAARARGVWHHFCFIVHNLFTFSALREFVKNGVIPQAALAPARLPPEPALAQEALVQLPEALDVHGALEWAKRRQRDRERVSALEYGLQVHHVGPVDPAPAQDCVRGHDGLGKVGLGGRHGRGAVRATPFAVDVGVAPPDLFGKDQRHPGL
ncbi:MAG: hypothetical protein CL678_11240, partial [Bdellovibrionaceae bacterium]|nr:hypothetical protein [Pseudobdellovibrionaceae bacterium]